MLGHERDDGVVEQLALVGLADGVVLQVSMWRTAPWYSAASGASRSLIRPSNCCR